MTKDDIKRVLGEFAAAAKRVDRIGYDVIELHAAHGYLAHQFLSPLSNQRTDEYGGSLENRMRFAIEMYEAVRAVWPERQAARHARVGHRLGRRRLDAGGNRRARQGAQEARPATTWTCRPAACRRCRRFRCRAGYQVPFAEKVKKESGITTMTVGLIAGYQQAEDIVASGKADLICIGRAAL